MLNLSLSCIEEVTCTSRLPVFHPENNVPPKLQAVVKVFPIGVEVQVLCLVWLGCRKSNVCSAVSVLRYRWEVWFWGVRMVATI